MSWWEDRRHIFAREVHRLDDAWPGNNFKFIVRAGQLWLTGAIPLALDESGQMDFEFELRYPRNYPFSVPYVYPKGREKDWVGNHQFISSGFCLDIREKSWNSSMSAVDILGSLERLLLAALDMISAKTKKLEVYEPKEPTKLDKIKCNIKCVIPSPFDISKGDVGEFKFHQKLNPNDSRLLVMPDLDINIENLKNEYFILWFFQVWSPKKGHWIKASLDQLESIVFKADVATFSAFLSDHGLVEEEIIAKWLDQQDETNYILFFVDNEALLIAQIDKKSQKVEYFGCYNQDLSKIYARLPTSMNNLLEVEKPVAVIGCGSAGSAIAEELVKSGVSKLILIDDDNLTVENVSRHTCDLHDIGLKKIHALRNSLRRINPKVDIECLDTRIHVIESEISDKLKECHLIINATATAEEIINEFCWMHEIPSIHSKVYPLGFGGEIVRILPKVTPCFECTHFSLTNILKDQTGFKDFPKMEIKNYNETQEGEVLSIPSLSTDAKFISLFVVKMALEVLRTKDMKSMTGANIILWANDKQWIFEQEFECLKIDTSKFQSYSNCIVCFGDKNIEKELGISTDEIDKLLNDVIITHE